MRSSIGPHSLRLSRNDMRHCLTSSLALTPEVSYSTTRIDCPLGWNMGCWQVCLSYAACISSLSNTHNTVSMHRIHSRRKRFQCNFPSSKTNILEPCWPWQWSLIWIFVWLALPHAPHPQKHGWVILSLVAVVHPEACFLLSGHKTLANLFAWTLQGRYQCMLGPTLFLHCGEPLSNQICCTDVVSVPHATTLSRPHSKCRSGPSQPSIGVYQWATDNS